MTPKRAIQLITSTALLLLLSLLYIVLDIPAAELRETPQHAAVETASSTATTTLPSSPQPTGDRVIRAVDGDTLKIERSGIEETVRLIGVDTPESVDPRTKVECFGKEAAAYTASHTKDARIRIELDPTQGERDRYGRLLAYVFLPNGELLNETLIRQGYAHEYTYRSAYAYQSQFKAAEQEAKSNQRGLWNPETCSL